MALRFFGLPPGLGSQRSLSARGQRLNAFAGIGCSLAFSLLALGGYLIEQQFANPTEDQSLALPIAALLIATAVTLLYCLLHSFRKLQHNIIGWPAAAVSLETKNVAVAGSASRKRQALDIPPPGRYVDRARIRIRR
jgi:hypothetical protein